MRRISVVIPCFNHARFVTEAIRSVAEQTWSDVELIVVDDGSTDGSSSAIEAALKDATSLARAVLLEQPNRGTHAALALGIANATGEIVTILNSDDRFHPHRLARIMAEAPERGDFLAFSMVRLIDAAGSPMPPESETARGYRHALYEASRCPTIGFALLRNNFAVTTGNFVFTRTLYDKVGGFGPYKLAHDWDFLLQSLVHVEPIFVPEPLLDYRTHGANSRAQLHDVTEQEGREILRRYLSRCEQTRPDNPLAPCEENWPVYFDLFVSRYHSWFGWGTIRSWMEDEPRQPAEASSAWRPWDAAVGSDPVEDSHYLVDPTVDPARRAALAIARDVLISAAHPLAVEEGPGNDTLEQVFERQAHRFPRLRLEPWISPIRLGGAGRAAPSADAAPRTSRFARHRGVGAFALVRGAVARFQKRLVVSQSGLVDAAFYRDQCRTRGIRVFDPVGHYLRVGAELGLDPHPLFQTRYYLARNPDVAGRSNPLVHYLFHGDVEGRKPHFLFDPMWYRWAHPDVARSGRNTLSHYVLYGAAEGRRAHPRFDPEYYREQIETPLSDGADPLAHYAVEGVARGIALNRAEGLRGRIEASLAAAPAAEQSRVRAREAALPRRLRASHAFDVGFYRTGWGSTFDDVADGARHFLERGAIEGIPIGPSDRVEAWLDELEERYSDGSHAAHAYLRAAVAPPDVEPGHCVTFYVSSKGNAFFREMAEHLAHGFRVAGAATRIRDERGAVDPPADRREHAIIVAPHEFFQLGDGPRRLSFELLQRSSIWIAEQPGSPYFSMCLWYARFARRVLDANPLTAVVWGELGIPCQALPLGWADGFPDYLDAAEIRSASVRQALAPEARSPISIDRPLAERPLEVFFNGVLTERRNQFFALSAGFFAELRTAFYMPVPWRPVSDALPSALDAQDATALAQRAKISLNVHRGDMPYFEWHRLVVRGIWQKSVVVTEPSYRVPWLEPGVHYVECPLGEIPRKLEWLLRTDEGAAELEAIRERAIRALRERYPLRAIAAAFLADDTRSDEPW
jgi:glycosyltransferase involved in cell wall biosynthesis